MTSDQFHEQQEKLLSELPEEFRSFVSWHAWERGHAWGYEEVINIVSGLVSELIPVIDSYTKGLKG